MKNAVIAAIVAAVVSASGGFAAGRIDTVTEYDQNARLEQLEMKVACLIRYANHDRALLCMNYVKSGPR